MLQFQHCTNVVLRTTNISANVSLSISTELNCLHFSIGRKVQLDQQDSAPPHSRNQQSCRFSPSSHRTSPQSSTLPVHPSRSCRRLAVGKSHSSSLSGLGGVTASERRNPKLQSGSRRVLSQVRLTCSVCVTLELVSDSWIGYWIMWVITNYSVLR